MTFDDPCRIGTVFILNNAPPITAADLSTLQQEQEKQRVCEAVRNRILQSQLRPVLLLYSVTGTEVASCLE